MWHVPYLGIPYKSNGRDRNGVDCYGLVLLVQREVFHRNIPEFADLAYDAADCAQSQDVIAQGLPLCQEIGWRRVDTCQEGDIILIHTGDRPRHVAIAYQSTPRMFHTTAQTRMPALARYDDKIWGNRRMEFWRWRD